MTNMLANFVLGHQKTTKLLLTAAPFLLVWTLTAIIPLWCPGVMEAIKATEEAVPNVFRGTVSAGAISSLYFSYQGIHYLWYWSENIYTDIENDPE